MQTDTETGMNATKNTSDDSLEAQIKEHDLIPSAEEVRNIDEWEAVAFGQPKSPLKGISANEALRFFQGEVTGEDIVIAVAEHAGTPYVVWLGTLTQAEEAFEKAA